MTVNTSYLYISYTFIINAVCPVVKFYFFCCTVYFSSLCLPPADCRSNGISIKSW